MLPRGRLTEPLIANTRTRCRSRKGGGEREKAGGGRDAVTFSGRCVRTSHAVRSGEGGGRGGESKKRRCNPALLSHIRQEALLLKLPLREKGEKGRGRASNVALFITAARPFRSSTRELCAGEEGKRKKGEKGKVIIRTCAVEGAFGLILAAG